MKTLGVFRAFTSFLPVFVIKEYMAYLNKKDCGWIGFKKKTFLSSNSFMLVQSNPRPTSSSTPTKFTLKY